MISSGLYTKFKNSPASLFVSSVSTLLVSTVVASAVTLGFSFIISRLYTPTQFGHFAIFMGTAGILAAACTGSMDRLIVLARSDAEARRAGTATLVLSLLCGAIVSIVGAVASILSPLEKMPFNLLELSFLLPLFIISYAGSQVFNAVGLRFNRVRLISSVKIAQALITGVVQVLLNTLTLASGLIIGSIAGWLIMLSGVLHAHVLCRSTWRELRVRAISSIFRRHWRYPCLVMPNEIVDTISNSAPLFLVGALISTADAGQYALAITMLSAPAAILGRTVGQAFLQYLGRHRGDLSSLRRSMIVVWAALAVLGAVPFATMAIIAPSIFQFAFGSAWLKAGVIAQYLSVLLFFRFVSSPTSSIYVKLGLQFEQSMFVAAAAVYRVAVYSLAALGVELQTVILLHVVIESIAVILYSLLPLRRLRPNII